MEEEKVLSVGGYLFYTENDARLARTELKKIEYLEARMDYSKPESIHMVYEKALRERIFKTPVGMRYMKGLQEFLLSQPDIDSESVSDIPLYSNFSGEFREKSKPAKQRIKTPEETEKKRQIHILSYLLNVLLIIAVIAMFSIALNSDNPNIINYEKNLVNKYASWDQQLTERENKIRETERELQWKD